MFELLFSRFRVVCVRVCVCVSVLLLLTRALRSVTRPITTALRGATWELPSVCVCVCVKDRIESVVKGETDADVSGQARVRLSFEKIFN